MKNYTTVFWSTVVFSLHQHSDYKLMENKTCLVILSHNIQKYKLEDQNSSKTSYCIDVGRPIGNDNLTKNRNHKSFTYMKMFKTLV